MYDQKLSNGEKNSVLRFRGENQLRMSENLPDH